MKTNCEHQSEGRCVPCFQAHIKSVGVSPRAMPSRVVSGSRSKQPTHHEPKNSWERGRARDHRGMPILNEQGGQLGVKQYAEQRHKYRDPRK